jgi:hypothetical protein
VDEIVICPPLPAHLTLSLFAFVSVTTCPCHLIFSHPPHTRPPTKRHQSHHPIPSPIYRSPHISLQILPRPPLTSSYLTLLTSPAIASILFRLPRTHLAAMCVKSAATRLSGPVSFRFGLPMALVQTHILRPSDLFVTVAPHSLSSTSITITILPALD